MVKLGPPGLSKAEGRSEKKGQLEGGFQTGNQPPGWSGMNKLRASLDLPKGRPMVAGGRTVLVEWLSWNPC